MGFLSLCGLTLGLLVGCSIPSVVDKPQRIPMFSPVVDSIVVLPIKKSEDTALNQEDLAKMHEELAVELGARPGIKLFAQPPTKLPNTLILDPYLEKLEVQELSSDLLFLRSIHITLRLKIQEAGSKGKQWELRREFSYQRAFPPNDPVPALPFDLVGAAQELSVQVAEALFPTMDDPELLLEIAEEPTTKVIYASKNLSTGNRMAYAHRWNDALRSWRLALYDPPEEKPEKRFRLSERGLYRLWSTTIPPETIRKLEVLLNKEPLELVEYRNLIRDTLGGPNEYESVILNVSDHSNDLTHLNLAAANHNLGQTYLLFRQYDLAAYYLGQAWAHYPLPRLLERWQELQTGRNNFPEGLDPSEAAILYLRVPPPRSLHYYPGKLGQAVLPTDRLTDDYLTKKPTPVPTAKAEPATDELQPVELPPVEGGVELPPIEQADQSTN